MKKICFLVQRYGLEVNGGAEQHCRQFAEHMCSYYDVTVVTSKAIDYMSWENEYLSDHEVINGVKVIRFPVIRCRDQRRFDEIHGKMLRGEEVDEQKWVNEQGPEMPQLLQWLADSKEQYDVFIFYTYLYYQTVMGLPLVTDKAIIVPTAHDEPMLRMKVFRAVFERPAGLFFLTEEEKDLVESRFRTVGKPYEIGGIGIDVPDSADGERFQQKYGVTDYILYAGRIDEGKNCDWLFRYFLEYKRRNPGPMKLVLIGKKVIPVPESPEIISLGFVDEQDKYDAMRGACCLVLPSKYESLSMAVLEAMACMTPVLVNGNCSVLKGHCKKSNAGLWYENYFEFEGSLNYLSTESEEVSAMRRNGRYYVEENYTWNTMEEKLQSLIERVVSKRTQ